MRRMTELRPPAAVIFPVLRASSLALIILATHSAHQLSAQRAPNIDPSTSRPPLLLTLPVAEANRQVRELALMKLIQALQSGNADLIDMVAGDLAIEEAASSGGCKTLREGVEAVRGSRTPGSQGTQQVSEALPIYAATLTQRDSAGMTIAEVQLLVAPKGKREIRTPARLTYDNSEAKWRSSKGILKGLCAAAGRSK